MVKSKTLSGDHLHTMTRNKHSVFTSVYLQVIYNHLHNGIEVDSCFSNTHTANLFITVSSHTDIVALFHHFIINI